MMSTLTTPTLKGKPFIVLLYKFPPGQTFARVPTGKQSCPWASYLCLGVKVTNWSEEQPQSEPAEDGIADFETSGQENNISRGTELAQHKKCFLSSEQLPKHTPKVQDFYSSYKLGRTTIVLVSQKKNLPLL